jgi:hypothetical protein
MDLVYDLTGYIVLCIHYTKWGGNVNSQQARSKNGFWMHGGKIESHEASFNRLERIYSIIMVGDPKG